MKTKQRTAIERFFKRKARREGWEKLYNAALSRKRKKESEVENG